MATSTTFSQTHSQTHSTTGEGKAPLGAAYDADAQAWFDAVEALSGSFDLSALNASYTESYTKQAWSDRITTLKATSGAWEAATEVIPLIGVTYHNSGGFRKLKDAGTATVTNSGFLSTDYVAAGTGAGLTGDGTSYLDSGYWFPNFTDDDLHLGTFFASNPSNVSNLNSIGAQNSIPGNAFTLGNNGTTSFRSNLPNTDAAINAGTLGASYLLGSRRGVDDAEAYVNGVSIGTDNTTASFSNSAIPLNLYLFARNLEGTGATGISSATLSGAHYGSGLTTPQAAAWSAFWNGIASDFA